MIFKKCEFDDSHLMLLQALNPASTLEMFSPVLFQFKKCYMGTHVIQGCLKHLDIILFYKLIKKLAHV